jgi:hypothetical protein
LPLLLALVLAAVLLARSRGPRETPHTEADRSATPSGAATGETVTVAVDFGDGRRREFDAVSWRDGMTVRDVLTAAVDSSGGVKFAQQGAGESAFLTEIDGVKNEGGGGSNWTFAVNGQFGDRSFAIYPLRAGDRVLWSFAEQQ